MEVNTLIKIEDVLGHYVEADVSLKSYFGKVRQTLTGRIIYSEYNASLLFKPKWSKNQCYFIESESDIHSVNIIRKDNKKHKYYKEIYKNKEQYEKEYFKRMEKEKEEKEKQRQLRQERIEQERQRKLEKEQQEINEAKKLGGYEKLEKEVIDFYKSFEGEFYNERLIKNIYVPLLNKLIHKAIPNVNDYPKYYFCKRNNPKFCKLIERKLNIKLGNTQKGNVEILNNYLQS